MTEERRKWAIRVAKILARARRTSFEEEAKTCLLKAQQLMAAWQLSHDDVKTIDEALESATVYKVLVDPIATPVQWRMYLASVVAANFRCYAYRRKSTTKRQPADKGIYLVGYDDDVALAAMVYQAAARVANKHALYFCRKNFKSILSLECRRARNVWLHGFVAGLKDRFRAQVDANSWALVVQLPGAVRAFRDNSAAIDAPVQELPYIDHFGALKAGYVVGRGFEYNIKIPEIIR